jgi:hypothetical protein
MVTKLTGALASSIALFCTTLAHAQSSQLPPPWKAADVGAVETAGTVAVGTNNDWHVSGDGSDIWGSADSFFYVYQPIGDGGIAAHVDSETDTNAFAKTGVMIRQSLDPGSPEVILDVKPDGGIEFMTRAAQGGETTFVAGGSVPVSSDGDGGVHIGVDLQLSRSGNMVTAVFCTPTCTVVGSTKFPSDVALIGIAVTSHDPSQLNTAWFRTPPTVSTVAFPWRTSDVGNVDTPGFATYDEATGTFDIRGDGSDIWGTADSFRRVSQQLNGNSTLSARLVREQNTDQFAKAGLIMDGPAASDPRVILDAKPDGGIEFMARSSAGAPMSFIAGSSASFPVWLRMTRSGDAFTGEMSEDGSTWTTVGSVTVTMPVDVDGGFAVTSHDPGALNESVFDNVGVTTGLGDGPFGPNLLLNPGFEESAVPDVGPDWVSDNPLRGTVAISETAAPHSGAQNGACRTTSADCGIYQEVGTSQSTTGNMMFSIYARADQPGALVGVNVDGQTLAINRVQVGGYQRYTVAFFRGSLPGGGHEVRVWMYTPAGVVVQIDDAELVDYFGPR